MPWAVVALAGGALLAVCVARAGMMLERRTRLQTAVDATALSAATAYARGLNIVAASNQLLFAAALSDAVLKLSGAGLVASVGAHAASPGVPVSFTQLVMNFQDVWAGTAGGGNNPLARGAGAAPAAMQAMALLIGARNGLAPIVLWNGRDGPDGLVPDLNVRRADATDLALWLGGGGKANAVGSGRSQVTSTTTREREEYSYQPRAGGPRVVLSREETERIQFRNRERVVQATREQARRGPLGASPVPTKSGLAGRFLKKSKVLEKVSRTFDLPMPLLEREAVHSVLVLARPADASSGLAARFPRQAVAPVAARADVGGGAVFNALYGDPAYDVRLCAVGANDRGVAPVLELLADPAAWRSWAARTAQTAALAWAQQAAWGAVRSRLPLPLI